MSNFHIYLGVSILVAGLIIIIFTQQPLPDKALAIVSYILGMGLIFFGEILFDLSGYRWWIYFPPVFAILIYWKYRQVKKVYEQKLTSDGDSDHNLTNNKGL